MNIAHIVTLMLAALIAGSGPVSAETLITAQEAALPQVSGKPPVTRGIVRGPGVKWISPRADVPVSSPFELKVAFESREGVKVDPSSIRMVYLKSPSVDLTARVQNALTASGINVTQAEVPPGTHTIRLSVRDQEGRETNSTMTIVVDK